MQAKTMLLITHMGINQVLLQNGVIFLNIEIHTQHHGMS